MGKRYRDSKLSREVWYRKLTPAYKCAWDFLCDECDAAGMWSIDLDALFFYVGQEFNFDEFLVAINTGKKRLEKFGKDKIFITGFVEFQYGTLSDACKPHIKIIALLKKYNLYERVYKGYTKGIQTFEEEEEEKEEETEEYKNEQLRKMNEAEMIVSGRLYAIIEIYKQTFTDYPVDQAKDIPAALEIVYKIAKQKGISKTDALGDKVEEIHFRWGQIVQFAYYDKWFKTRSISDLSNEWQRLINSMNGTDKQNNKQHASGKPGTSEARVEALKNWGRSETPTGS